MKISKTTRFGTQLLLLSIALAALTGCVPAPVKPNQVPGESRDPGRFEDAAANTADRAGNKQEATAQRQRATEKREEAFESDCNVVTFFLGLFNKNYLCVGPVKTEPQKQAHLM